MRETCSTEMPILQKSGAGPREKIGPAPFICFHYLMFLQCDCFRIASTLLLSSCTQRASCATVVLCVLYKYGISLVFFSILSTTISGQFHHLDSISFIERQSSVSFCRTLGLYTSFKCISAGFTVPIAFRKKPGHY